MWKGLKFAGKHWDKWLPIAINVIPGVGQALSAALGSMGKVGSVISNVVGVGKGVAGGVWGGIKAAAKKTLFDVGSNYAMKKIFGQPKETYDPSGNQYGSHYQSFAQGIPPMTYRPSPAYNSSYYDTQSQGFQDNLAYARQKLFMEEQQMNQWRQTRINMLPWS